MRFNITILSRPIQRQTFINGRQARCRGSFIGHLIRITSFTNLIPFLRLNRSLVSRVVRRNINRNILIIRMIMRRQSHRTSLTNSIKSNSLKRTLFRTSFTYNTRGKLTTDISTTNTLILRGLTRKYLLGMASISAVLGGQRCRRVPGGVASVPGPYNTYHP